MEELTEEACREMEEEMARKEFEGPALNPYRRPSGDASAQGEEPRAAQPRESRAPRLSEVLREPDMMKRPRSSRSSLASFNVIDVVAPNRHSVLHREDPMTLKHSRGEKLAYFLDCVLAKRWAFSLFLVLVGLAMVGLFGLAYSIVAVEEEWGEERNGGPFSWDDYIEGVWSAWTFMADPGTHADVTTSGQRILGSIITLGGILFFASILGVTVDMVREKMDSLRQGKSRIVESGHTLILGWTEKTFHIVEELCEANASEGGGVIAILANESKERMEDELRIQLPVKRRRGTRIVVRTGSSLVANDLLRVSVHMARAVVILASPGEADRADADTLRTMLTLRNMFSSLHGHVVAEVRDIDNEPLVKMVGGDVVETLVSHDMIGRLMLMSVRQPGLAKVYEALLGFEGDEFYMAEWPELVGRTFGELVGMFPDAVPVGVVTATGDAVLNPGASHGICPGDQLIVIAEDNNTYKPHKPVPVEAGEPPKLPSERKQREVILFCGWRRDVRDILQQLDRMVERGSEVHLMTHCVPVSKRNERLMEDGMDVSELKNLQLVHFFGNTSVRRKLEALPLEKYSSCMIFADQLFETEPMHADSHSLATLLLIRNIQAQRNLAESGGGEIRERLRKISCLTDRLCPMICEILDPHTQRTVAESDHLVLASDFCRSNRLIAQVLTMVSEERAVKVLLNELLGSKGVSIHVVPPTRYALPGEGLSFWALSKRALQFHETVIGYQLRNSTEGTVLNPPKKGEVFAWDRCDLAILKGEMTRGSNLHGTSSEELAEKHWSPGAMHV